MMHSAMPDSADVLNRTRPRGRSLVIATLIIWALVVAAAALIGLDAAIAMLVFMVAVFGLAWG